MSAEDVAPDVGASSSEALQVVVIFYGGFSLAQLIIFCLVRNRFQKLYNCRKSVEDLNCELCKREWGMFDWMPGVLSVTEDELFEQCGFDTVSFCRILKLGMKLSMIGCFNAIWLIPTYSSSPKEASNVNVTDALDELTLGNVPTGDSRLFGSLIAAYIMTFAAIYLLYNEFFWYIAERHRFMSRESPQNYAVYVSGVPPELRSKRALGDFFRFLFKDSILEIELVKKISEMNDLKDEREELERHLAHEVGDFEDDGDRPTRLTSSGFVDAIESYQMELKECKTTINTKIDQLEEEWEEHEQRVLKAKQAGEPVGEPPENIDDAAFVSFKTLQSTTTALQLLHHHTPFNLLAQEAPLPKDVYWGNIGINHWRLQFTSICAGFLTLITCVLWTIPVTFISTFTKVESLKEEFEFLRTISDNFSLFNELLALVAPIALIQLTNLLPVILGWFCQLEGHIGENQLQASLFSKLTFFMIVQVFFVSAISGSLFDQINELADDPANKTINILATSLPGQAVTFMAYILVKSTVGMSDELTRLWIAIYAGIRKLLPPNKTEDERAEDVTFINIFTFAPLCNPGNMDYTALFSDVILMFIILFVYAVLAPLACFVMTFGFFCLQLAYRNQVIFIYDPSNDTGGKLWPKVAGYIIVTMLISQVTIFGVLALKEGSIQSTLMIPLIVLTILFWRYMGQQHFRVANTLPIVECHERDDENKRNEMNYDFVLGAYKQEALIKLEDEEEDEAEEGSSSEEQPIKKKVKTKLRSVGKAISNMVNGDDSSEQKAKTGAIEHSQLSYANQQYVYDPNAAVYGMQGYGMQGGFNGGAQMQPMPGMGMPGTGMQGMGMDPSTGGIMDPSMGGMYGMYGGMGGGTAMPQSYSMI